MTCFKKTFTARNSDLTIFIPNRQSIVLLFLVEQVFPEPPYFLFIIGIFGKILYKHFLFVPGPYDSERCLKVRNTLQSARPGSFLIFPELSNFRSPPAKPGDYSEEFTESMGNGIIIVDFQCW